MAEPINPGDHDPDLIRAVGERLNEHWPHLLNDGVQYRVAVDALDGAVQYQDNVLTRLRDAETERDTYRCALVALVRHVDTALYRSYYERLVPADVLAEALDTPATTETTDV
ncbi:hypothetical protein OIE13_22695 [Streptosporangium sp. NBC_01810]|uniref:hypothetical protein n=1 Tax=Streptosporangium sp. NBC_01810 TaxID=2975951 RepID=UPI002DD844C5|nr:hypothetical protein [Streptosporangium sp. NBC_01810]WSA23754.1 hypothetical protein OIE13_22695 [Streptosporangium sp. NBC_01810]